MFGKIKVSEKIYMTGVNDRRTALFENMWPLPHGVAYNSYLIVDDKTALIDTVEFKAGKNFVAGLDKYLCGRNLDYLVVNHMELDHSAQIKELISRYPEIKISGNEITRRILEGYFGKIENFTDISKGRTIDLGRHKLSFVMTPWVHWPETMMTYDTTEGILFSGDAFGSFGTLDGGIFDDEIDFDFYSDEMLRYYSNIVGKYSPFVQKAFEKVACLNIRTICPAHGPIWRSNPEKVIGLYDKWSKYESDCGAVVIFASMYGNTENSADYIGRKLSENGVKNIRIHDVSKTHISYLIRDVWKYNGVILGSCSYNNEMFPLMQQLCAELEHAGVKNKKLGIFGSYSWSGGGVKNLLKFAENISWEQVHPPVEIRGIPSDNDFAEFDAFAEAMAAAILR